MLFLRAKILLFYILLQKYNNISKHARKSGKSYIKNYQKVLGEAGMYHILARIRTEIQSHTSLRCATSPVAQPYEPSASSPILPAWEKSSL